jgi:hypothetical protein
MAVIHHTTLKPTKLELLTTWLPRQPWYAGTGSRPVLEKAGGFRLDDPRGEVGIEFMAVADTSGPEPVLYQVPMTYRGAPLDGADAALIGTTEHGVLGKRWVYDGIHDPVLVQQLFALLLGRTEPQAQSLSDTPDQTVTARLTGPEHRAPVTLREVTDGTDLRLETTAADPEQPAQHLTLRVNRVLRPGEVPGALGDVTADWQFPNGGTHRGHWVVAHPAPAR